MKELHTVQRGSAITRHVIKDDALADAAYAALKAGMAEFREYGNDRAATVSVPTDSGEITIRLADLLSVEIYLRDAAAEDFEFEILRRRHDFDKRCAAAFEPTPTSSRAPQERE